MLPVHENFVNSFAEGFAKTIQALKTMLVVQAIGLARAEAA
jgi:hypothetical protein